MNFGDFFQRVGNLFTGGGWVNDEEERRRQRQQQQQQAAARPSSFGGFSRSPQSQNVATVQTPQSLLDPIQSQQSQEPNTPLIVGGVSTNPSVARAQKILREGGSATPFKPEIIREAQRVNAMAEPSKPKPTFVAPKEEPKEPNIFQKIAAGFQQGLGRVADTAVQGGSALTMFGTEANPFISEEQRQKKRQQDIAAAETLRGGINRWRDVTGNSIVGNRDVDEAAGRIAAGRGDAEDIAAVAGRGLDVAGTSTMFINPARTFSGAATTVAPVKELIPHIGRESLLYGGLEGTTAALDEYGDTGSLMRALEQFAPNFVLGAAGQAGLEAGAYGAGRSLRGIAGRTPFVGSPARAGSDAARFLEESAVREPTGSGIIPSLGPTRAPEILPLNREPITPITSSPNISKPPAITSPNRPPTVQTPAGVSIPETAGVQPPTVEMGVRMPEAPQAPQPQVPAADELAAAAQKALNDASVQPPAQPAPVQALNTRTPDQVAAEAAPAPVVTPEVVAAAARQAENMAPTEAIVRRLTEAQAPFHKLAREDLAALDSAKLDSLPASIDEPVGELGKMTQSAIQSGRQLDDAGWEELATQVGRAADEAASSIGTDVPTILGKVQRAYDNRKQVKSAKDAGLSDAEFDVYKKLINEQTYLRNRADPALLGDGNIPRWYSPRQTPDTEFDPDLVNEISRRSDGLRTEQLDLTTTPIEQAIRRYGNAQRAITDDVISKIESAPVTENGTTRLADTGIRVSDEAKAEFSRGAEKYIQQKDAVERALADTDVSPKKIDKMVSAAEDDLDAAFAKLIDDIPKNTAEGRNAIARLQERRGAYIQSSIRTNMFSNIVNRVLDHIGSNIVRSTNQIVGLADAAASLATGRRVLAGGREARGIARNYAKGALGKNLVRDFKTSVNLAPTKLGKADAMFRAAGTAITGSSDLTTTVVKMTNRMMLARAQAQGITSKAGMEKYLRENINSPEYKELLTGVNDIYNGYLGLPTSLTSRMGTTGRWFSKVDNLVNAGLEKFAPQLPPRVRRELNDLIMPALSGFAGATYRIGKKALNSSMAGIPGIVKGTRLMREGGEASQQIGQMMIIRSMIDGLVGGVAGAASVGALVSNQMEWTGPYPEGDPNKAALWERQGITPNSLRFNTGQKDGNGNDIYVQIQPGRVLGPFSLPVVLPAVIKSGGTVGDVFDATLGQMIENMGAEGVLRNAGNISTALTGSGYAREKAIENLMSSAGFSVSNVVPLSGLQNNVANAADDVKRDTSNNRFTDSILNRNPFTRESLPEKTDNLGDPVRNNTLLGSSAVTTARKPSQDGEAQANAFDSEMERLSSAGFNDVMPGRDVTSKTATKDAELLLGTGYYKSLSDEGKAEALKKSLSATTTKEISTKLDDSQRATLIEHKLMNEDQRKVWKEDNTNALNYFEAEYMNKEASGTLSADDKDINKTGSLAQDIVAARVDAENNVPQELTQMFDNTNKTEFNNLPEEAQNQLIAYDKARVAAGLPSKFQNKYGTYGKLGRGGRGGRGGGRGGAGKGFAFASLPASLVGTGATGGSSPYADNAPLFKPIPDLRAPESKPIPRGRTISVKKGIQI